MSLEKVILICAVTLLSIISTPMAQEWRGLRPMHSSCEDVKRALGVATCEPPDGIYDLGTERVRIAFSKAPCEKAWQKLWNVPPGTVLIIERYLRKPIAF